MKKTKHLLTAALCAVLLLALILGLISLRELRELLAHIRR